MTAGYFPKILIVAPNASVRFGGEAILPLHFYRLLLKRGYFVQLVTHARNRDELLALPDCDLKTLHFIPDSKLHTVVWKAFSKTPDRVRDLIGGGILNWLNEVYQKKLIKQLVSDGLVDLIHQPTPVSPLTPSSQHNYGVPLIIGPMNGAMNYPRGYEDLESIRTRIAVSLGRYIALIINRLICGKRKAAVLLVANQRTRNALPFPNHPNIETMVENGVDFSLWKPSEKDDANSSPRRLRLVFMGRFEKWKGIDITLRAMSIARSKGADVTLDVLGDGDERDALTKLATDLGLSDYVFFHGFQPQNACADFLRRSDALILNSLRECGGAVILEAMAVGLPVIASAWGGPMDYVSAESGLLVDPVPRESFPDRLAGAMIKLSNDPEARNLMGKAAQKIARSEYDWERKMDRMIEIYRAASKQP